MPAISATSMLLAGEAVAGDVCPINRRLRNGMINREPMIHKIAFTGSLPSGKHSAAREVLAIWAMPFSHRTGDGVVLAWGELKASDGCGCPTLTRF
jgi:hypothetical protein